MTSQPKSRSAIAAIAVALLLAGSQQPALAQAQNIFTNNNPDGVENGPSRPTVFELRVPAMMSKITTYHWNRGQGTQAPGSISLRSASGETFGPWQATGEAGQGGVPNAYWVAYPNVSLTPGQYTVIDPDPATWAQNAASGRAGMAWAEGFAQ